MESKATVEPAVFYSNANIEANGPQDVQIEQPETLKVTAANETSDEFK